MNCSKTLQITNLNCRQSLQLTNTLLKKQQAPVFVKNKREMYEKVADKSLLGNYLKLTSLVNLFGCFVLLAFGGNLVRGTTSPKPT